MMKLEASSSSSSVSAFAKWLSVTLLVATSAVVHASIQSIDIVLFPNPEFVQYTDAYIRGPGGVIDLSQLSFIPTSPSYISFFNENGGSDDDEYLEDIYNEEYNDEEGDDETDDWTTDDEDGDEDGDGDGGGRTLRRQRRLSAMMMKKKHSYSRRNVAANTTKVTNEVIDIVPAVSNTTDSEESIQPHDTTVDIVVFPLNSKCTKDEDNCDWSTLGIGKRIKSSDAGNNDDELRWCCDEETIRLNLCTQEEYGKLIIDTTIFKGKHQMINIPYEGAISGNDINIKELYIEEDTSATYVVMFANCDAIYGRDVTVNGKIIFESKHGYLPGELYGFLRFFTILSIIYIILFFWYNNLMRRYKDSRIDIEKWIKSVILLGCIEMILKTIDYVIWNNIGHRSSSVIWTGIFFGVLKQGFTRCLIVMVSMGWGVIRNTLGTTMHTIVCLGGTFILVSMLVDGMVLVAYEQMSSISYHTATEILDVITLLTAVRETINVIFTIWIIDSLSKTMHYLSTQKNQSHKLQRTQQLRTIIVLAVIFRCMIAFVSWMIDNYQDESIVREEFAWAKEAAVEVNYLFVLVSIAILWRPNESAREYAYVMELGTMDDDNDELELSAIETVPSAMEDDADDDIAKKGNYEIRSRTEMI